MAVAAVAAEIRGTVTVITATQTSSSRVTVSRPRSPVHLLSKPHKEMPLPLTRMPSMVATTTISQCGIHHSSNRDSSLVKLSRRPVRRPDVHV
jgi:hypothetical protein